MTSPNIACALVIPDSLLAKEATEILRKYSTDLLFDHKAFPSKGDQPQAEVRRSRSAHRDLPARTGYLSETVESPRPSPLRAA